jgi:hypothetical protein
MIVVHETWCLKPEFVGEAERIMQEMDDLVGPPAHEHPGWRGHAGFYQDIDQPAKVILVYPWASQESHQTLVRNEEEVLAGFTAKYCGQPREISYYLSLAVDVDES